jgi:hypothetical protein
MSTKLQKSRVMRQGRTEFVNRSGESISKGEMNRCNKCTAGGQTHSKLTLNSLPAWKRDSSPAVTAPLIVRLVDLPPFSLCNTLAAPF